MTYLPEEISAKYTQSEADFPAFSHALVKHIGMFVRADESRGQKAQFSRRLILNFGPTIFSLLAISLIPIVDGKTLFNVLPPAGLIFLAAIIYLSTSISLRMYFAIIKTKGEAGLRHIFDETVGLENSFRISQQGFFHSTARSEHLYLWQMRKPYVDVFGNYLLILLPDAPFAIPIKAFNLPIEDVKTRITNWTA